MMLRILSTPDEAGAARLCELCETPFTAAAEQPRAWCGEDYIGFICSACVAAAPDELIDRIRPVLAEVQDRASQLAFVTDMLLLQSPSYRRRRFVALRGGRMGRDNS